MNKIECLALTYLMVLPSLSVKSEEIVLPPSQAEIEAFNACLKGKATDTCVLPTRIVIVPDEDTAPDMTPIPEREFYQSPPDELVNGIANTEMRERIRNAKGYRTYEWGPIITQDGPAEPFGSYSRDRSAGVGRDREDTVGGDPAGNPGGVGDPGGVGSSGPGDPDSDPGGGSSTGSGGPGQNGGPDCR